MSLFPFSLSHGHPTTQINISTSCKNTHAHTLSYNKHSIAPILMAYVIRVTTPFFTVCCTVLSRRRPWFCHQSGVVKKGSRTDTNQHNRSHHQGHPPPSPDGSEPKGRHGHHPPHSRRRRQHRAICPAPDRHPSHRPRHEVGHPLFRRNTRHLW